MKDILKKIFGCLFIILITACFIVSGTEATLLDLTTMGASGETNESLFYVPLTSVGASGSGLIDAFLPIRGRGASESGYNTDGTLEFDTQPGAHSLQLSEIQTNIVNIGGTDYYEFTLDVNETSSYPLITLNSLKFYLFDIPDQSGYGASWDTALVYDFDDGPDGDSAVTLDYLNFAGSGGGIDLMAFIPTSYFGSDTSKYVYLYSEFGMPDDLVVDGYEEWAHKTTGTFTPPGGPTVPEPGTIFLLSIGIFSFFGIKRKMV